ncbi:hypothetical protein [Marinimicrobium sp. C2-29]|uniref:hypothetical protein n=1 Tax=Marinimicrobium sp. C2-29 TaxID=3139825 RepID=UPI0031399ABF
MDEGDRVRSIWRRWLLLPLLVAVPLFFIGGPDWVSPPVYRTAWSQGHMVFFALFIVWLGHWIRLDTPRRWLFLSLAVFFSSLVIEAIQSQVGRDASWNDVMRNLIGTWFGLFWGLRPDWRVWTGRFLSSLLLLWQLAGLGSELLSHYHRVQQFPVLSDFEHQRDLASWSGGLKRVTEPVAQGEYSLAIPLGDPSGERRYTGASLNHLVSDWRGYQWLAFSLHTEQPLVMTLRINDHRHDRHSNRYDDRLNKRLELAPGWNHYRISLAEVREAPAGRDMNLAGIGRLLLFATNISEKQTIHLDHLRLE